MEKSASIFTLEKYNELMRSCGELSRVATYFDLSKSWLHKKRVHEENEKLVLLFIVQIKNYQEI